MTIWPTMLITCWRLTMKTNYNRPLLVLRSTVFWVWSILNTLVMALPVLLGRLFSYEFSADMSMVWARANLWGLKTFCGISWNVEGVEHIPTKPCIVLSKHQSTFDTYIIPTFLPRMVYVAKRSLAIIPIFGWALLALNFILIDRKSGRSAITQMVEQARQRLAAGMFVIIFPEGTRVPIGAEPNYRIGGAAVAEQTGVDVLPVALNAGEFWPRMGYIKWPGEITVRFGPVISTTGKTAEQVLKETESWIETQMKEITVLNRFPY